MRQKKKKAKQKISQQKASKHKPNISEYVQSVHARFKEREIADWHLKKQSSRNMQGAH